MPARPPVRLAAVAGGLDRRRAVPRRHLVARVGGLVEPAGADREQHAAVLARADERVGDARGAVHEVPAAQRPLLALDDREHLAVEHEERLLHGLVVVERRRLARRQVVHVDPEVLERERLAVLEAGERPRSRIAHAGGVRDVDHEPPLALRPEARRRLSPSRLRACGAPYPRRPCTRPRGKPSRRSARTAARSPTPARSTARGAAAATAGGSGPRSCSPASSPPRSRSAARRCC